VNPAAGAASSEVVTWYPHPNVRIANTRSAGATTSYLHRNQLDSVVLIADAGGGQDIERIYEPFGVDAEYILDVTAANDDIGFIGERKDAVAGLQYLNARYYDPELGMFIQPDWWEVTRAGVGTNRYAYSGNDPVNLRDPGGNAGVDEAGLGLAVGILGLGAVRGIPGAQDALDGLFGVFSDSGDDGPSDQSDDSDSDESSGGNPDPNNNNDGSGIPVDVVEAADRLGIDIENIDVENGVARTKIAITEEINLREVPCRARPEPGS
jgi:RHS repeat-associated protein